MNPGAKIGVAIVVAVLAAGGGYWAGSRQAPPSGSGEPAPEAGKPARQVLYYRNPMGLPDTSPTPKKDSMGMDYIPVYAGEDTGAAPGESGAGGQVRISTDKVQKLGVRTEAAELRTLARTVRASGRIEPDERRIFAISPKFEGYVERLHVAVTGQPVSKGQALFEVYSPELVSAQREYAIAAQGVKSLQGAGSEVQGSMGLLAESSLARLRNWDISPEQIQALARSGEARRSLTFRSPVSGVVTEKKALQGMRFMPGEALYQVADLSSVWVVAEVAEQDIGLVKSGARAKVRINAYPGQVFEGPITYVYPTLTTATRTVPVRVEVPNPGTRLKPGMYAQVELPVASSAPAVTVPLSAVIDSGTRQLVLVQLEEGRFSPRQVKLGARSDDYVEVREGVREGERVVVAANFLIDAESNLRAAIGGFGSGAAPAAVPASAGHRASGKVEEVDAKGGTVSVSHGPVASLKWPAMTMEFKVANGALLKELPPGANVDFEFVERAPGEWVITGVRPAAAPSAHTGH